MITICWAAKGGSGTTVVAATLALAAVEPTLIVDLAGDQPAVLGLPDPDSPGVGDWLRSDAPADRLRRLEVAVDQRVALLPAGRRGDGGDRWSELAGHLANDHRDVVVDAGCRPAPPALAAVAHRTWLVTRPCYLALRAAVRRGDRPDGIVLVEEPGRALGVDDIEAALGAPVVARVLVDPAVARAVDAGLLVARVPGTFARRLREVA